MDARKTYELGRETRGLEVAAFERQTRAIAMARLVCAFGVIGLFCGIVWGGLAGPEVWGGVGALIALFIALVVVHARAHAKKDRAAASMRFHERGLDRLEGRWTTFAATGERYAKEDHPYADDLDVFGRASLFQLICAAETALGQNALAVWLAGADSGEDPHAAAARQAAVKELAPLVAFREGLSSAGALLVDNPREGKPDPALFLAWAEQPASLGSRGALTVLAKVLPVVTIASYFLAPMAHVTRAFALLPLGIGILIGLATRGLVEPATAAASSRQRGLGAYAEMLARIEREPFASPLLKEMQTELRASGVLATREMSRLARIVDFLDARQNEVFRIFIGPLLMWDLNCALALDAWRARAGKTARTWLTVLGDVEALASLGGFAFDRPDHAFPVFGPEPKLVATALGHPLLAATKRVANDVTLAGPGHALVITGSNMSGKSTLLRAIGVNAVLARAGAPVCATALAMGPMQVATSMRVRDSLEEGVSRFYAELKKLKTVITMVRKGPCLFLLDEVLHGTNSRERLIGARAIVRELVAKGALGGVSTHDLALGDLETEFPGRIKNVHFEEQVSGEVMTFDYHLRDGVVQSSNALRLMKIVGLDVVHEN